MEIIAEHGEMLQHGLNTLYTSRAEKSHPALSITRPWVRQGLGSAPNAPAKPHSVPLPPPVVTQGGG